MKLAIVVRKELGMRTGKIAVQVAHASVDAYIKGDSKKVLEWHGKGQHKIVLKVPTGKDLLELYLTAESLGLPVCEVIDFGLTQVEPGTVTCIAIGPDEDYKIDEVTKGLSLL
jgi:peptidyl-tRNA hydrolase, PTH2 family